MMSKQNDQPCETEKINLSLNYNQKLNKQPFLDKSIIKCQQKNISNMFCLNKNCKQKNPFYCIIEQCSCYQLHKKCQKGNTKYFLDAIEQKIIDIQQLKAQVEIVIQKQITRLSDFRQTLLNLIDTKFKFIQLDKLEKQFYDLYRNQVDIQSFNSNNLAKIWEIVQAQNYKQFRTKQVFKKQINELTRINIQTIDKIQNNVKSKIKSIQLNYGCQPLIEQSQIIKTYEDYQKLTKFFPEKLSSMKLIFKASPFQFNLASYFQICRGEFNTVIICITQCNKIFGGFSVYDFYPSASQKIDTIYVQPENKNFLFSLTQNIKFPQNIGQSSIKCYMSNEFAIQFLKSFSICQNANINSQSFFSLNQTNYKNISFKHDSKDYLKFVGTKDGKFKVKEWEVYKIKYKPQQ